MPLELIDIPDDSDCQTCSRRHADAWDTLGAVRCDVLTGVICPECGREFEVLTETMEQSNGKT